MKVAFALIALVCEGHTNAKCLPTVEYFQTRQACEAARITTAEDFFGNKSKPYADPRSFCLGVIAD